MSTATATADVEQLLAAPGQEDDVREILRLHDEWYAANHGIWKMWHFHGSNLPPADEARPPYGDTAESRGEW